MSLLGVFSLISNLGHLFCGIPFHRILQLHFSSSCWDSESSEARKVVPRHGKQWGGVQSQHVPHIHFVSCAKRIPRRHFQSKILVFSVRNTLPSMRGSEIKMKKQRGKAGRVKGRGRHKGRKGEKKGREIEEKEGEMKREQWHKSGSEWDGKTEELKEAWWLFQFSKAVFPRATPTTLCGWLVESPLTHFPCWPRPCWTWPGPLCCSRDSGMNPGRYGKPQHLSIKHFEGGKQLSIMQQIFHFLRCYYWCIPNIQDCVILFGCEKHWSWNDALLPADKLQSAVAWVQSIAYTVLCSL